MATLTSVVVFAIAQLLGVIVAPFLHGFPPLLRSLLLTALTVVLLTYIVMPRVTRLFYRWLYPK